MDAYATPATSLPEKGHFNLVRRLSITSLIALIVTASLLVMLYRHDQMEEHSEVAARENEKAAQQLTRLLGGYLAYYTTQMDGLDAAVQRANPDIALLD